MAYNDLTKEEQAMVLEAVRNHAADIRRMVSGETREQVDRGYKEAAVWSALVVKLGNQ